MQFNTLFFMLILSCVSLSLAHVNFGDCCLKYVTSMGPIMQKHVVKYGWQKSDGDCNLRAVIFTMRKGRRYCGNPTDKWVIELMEKLDRTPIMKHSHHSRRG